jgi:hypothetical protein
MRGRAACLAAPLAGRTDLCYQPDVYDDAAVRPSAHTAHRADILGMLFAAFLQTSHSRKFSHMLDIGDRVKLSFDDGSMLPPT